MLVQHVRAALTRNRLLLTLDCKAQRALCRRHRCRSCLPACLDMHEWLRSTAGTQAAFHTVCSHAQRAAGGGFWSYAAGVAYKFVVEFCVGGLEVDNYRTTLPLKKGLSSSAAFCVLVGALPTAGTQPAKLGGRAEAMAACPAPLASTKQPTSSGELSSIGRCDAGLLQVARAFNRAYNLRLTVRGEMEYAYQGERLTPSMCGKMDQAVAFGQVGGGVSSSLT